MKGNNLFIIGLVFISAQTGGSNIQRNKIIQEEYSIKEQTIASYQFNKLDSSINHTKRLVEVFHKEDSLYYEVSMKFLQEQDKLIRAVIGKENIR